MTDQNRSERERELELDVARMKAELADLRGNGSVEATSRFLAMAASTIDVAMEEAREEAGKARAEAAEITSTALADAVEIKANAESEAMALIDVERHRVADEIDALHQVRAALQSERHELEEYHAELRRRVQELAESMVAFMSTEPPIASVAVIEELVVPDLQEAEPPHEEESPVEFSGIPVVEVEQGPSMFSRSGNWLVAAPDASSTVDMAAPHSVEEMVEEKKFEEFIDGDEDDKSRDWLLQHEAD